MCQGKIRDILKAKWPDVAYLTQGGNSYIFSATDKGRFRVAIKVYRLLKDSRRYKRFNHEIDVIKELSGTEGGIKIIESNPSPPVTPIDCDNIASIKDLAFFTMPLYEGNLASIIPTIPTYDDDGSIAVDILLQCSHFIKKLHNKNKAHRDFKPENVLHNNDKRYVVSDYGLSIDLASIPEDRATGAGEQIGSLSYRAPELLRGRLDSTDHRPVDIYALGRTLWALLVGKEPHGVTDYELQQQKIMNLRPSIRYPALLDRIIEGAIQIDPKNRLTIDGFIEALDTWKMDIKKGTSEDLIRKIENNPYTLGMIEFRRKVKFKLDKQQEMLAYIGKEMDILTKEWQAILLRTPSIRGNDPVVIGAIYYPDFSPEILEFEEFKNVDGQLFRFNLDLKVAPRLQLALYVDWQEEKYRVVGAYLPKSESDDAYTNFSASRKAYDSDTVKFSYSSEEVPIQMLGHIKKAYIILNDVLQSNIV